MPFLTHARSARAPFALSPSVLLGLAVALLALPACGPQRNAVDAGRRDAFVPDSNHEDPSAWLNCVPGQQRCYQDLYQQCFADGEFTRVETTDCVANGQVCVDGRWCVACRPGSMNCSDDATQVVVCRDDGSGSDPVQTCDTANGEACRNGRCVQLCTDSNIADTNIGCEYYAVDLDNAVTGAGQSAASQQYAVVVSNPDPNFTARVRIEWNTAPQGMPARPSMVASALIPPMDLEVFRLPAREVDCSAAGTFNTGTGTCLSSQAYHIVSTIPVIAYQFNPLENVAVFSNDASLLLPTNSVNGDYLVMGYPQTIARTTDPSTNFDIDLRAYLTIVGSVQGTTVHVTPSTDVIPGTGVPDGAAAGTPIDVTLGPFDVLNLETGGFLADFTGTRITTQGGPVSVFSGSEASDSPVWMTLSDRQCCADHLEEQLAPVRTAAQDFVAVHMRSRTAAVLAAGGNVAVVPEPEFYRVLGAGSAMVHVATTLPSDPTDPESAPDEFDLMPGEEHTLRSTTDFEIHGDGPLIVSTVTGGQQTTGIPTGLPGGDPSMIMLPPIRQWRQNYVFLTPDKYAFDFVTIVARPNTNVTLDNTPLPYADCPVSRADACVDRMGHPCPDPTYVVYRCQLSYPVIDTSQNPAVVQPGRQADGVHVVSSDDEQEGVMVIVSGFDSYVGYGYPAGTRLVTVD